MLPPQPPPLPPPLLLLVLQAEQPLMEHRDPGCPTRHPTPQISHLLPHTKSHWTTLPLEGITLQVAMEWVVTRTTWSNVVLSILLLEEK